jgi:hypothetical protein
VPFLGLYFLQFIVLTGVILMPPSETTTTPSNGGLEKWWENHVAVRVKLEQIKLDEEANALYLESYSELLRLQDQESGLLIQREMLHDIRRVAQERYVKFKVAKDRDGFTKKEILQFQEGFLSSNLAEITKDYRGLLKERGFYIEDGESVAFNYAATAVWVDDYQKLLAGCVWECYSKLESVLKSESKSNKTFKKKKGYSLEALNVCTAQVEEVFQKEEFDASGKRAELMGEIASMRDDVSSWVPRQVKEESEKTLHYKILGYRVLEILQMLKADVSSLHDDSEDAQLTPMHCAVQEGYFDLAFLFLACGAEIIPEDHISSDDLDDSLNGSFASSRRDSVGSSDDAVPSPSSHASFTSASSSGLSSEDEAVNSVGSEKSAQQMPSTSTMMERFYRLKAREKDRLSLFNGDAGETWDLLEASCDLGQNELLREYYYLLLEQSLVAEPVRSVEEVIADLRPQYEGRLHEKLPKYGSKVLENLSQSFDSVLKRYHRASLLPQEDLKEYVDGREEYMTEVFEKHANQELLMSLAQSKVDPGFFKVASGLSEKDFLFHQTLLKDGVEPPLVSGETGFQFVG